MVMRTQLAEGTQPVWPVRVWIWVQPDRSLVMWTRCPSAAGMLATSGNSFAVAAVECDLVRDDDSVCGFCGFRLGETD